MNMNRRGALSLAALPLGATILLGCSSNNFPKPPGDWQRVSDGNLLVAVPSGWKKSSPGDGTWTTKWTDSKKQTNVLLTAKSTEESDVFAALDTQADAARCVTRGYRLVGERVSWSDGSTVLARQDYEVDWPTKGYGSTWAISKDGNIALVNLFNEKKDKNQFDTVGGWIELTSSASSSSASSSAAASAIASTRQDGTQSITFRGLGCAVPAGWVDTGPLEGSQRWADSWALADSQGILTQRLFLAPSVPQKSVQDALSAIEKDSADGALENFSKLSQQAVSLSGFSEGIRLDFGAGKSGSDQGAIWVVRKDSRIAAVQYSGTGTIDASLRTSIEQSLTLD